MSPATCLLSTHYQELVYHKRKRTTKRFQNNIVNNIFDSFTFTVLGKNKIQKLTFIIINNPIGKILYKTPYKNTQSTVFHDYKYIFLTYIMRENRIFLHMCTDW